MAANSGPEHLQLTPCAFKEGGGAFSDKHVENNNVWLIKQTALMFDINTESLRHYTDPSLSLVQQIRIHDYGD